MLSPTNLAIAASVGVAGILVGANDFLNDISGNTSEDSECESVFYHDFLRDAEDGDILIAASKKKSAMLTRSTTRSPWTHVGMVIRGKTLGMNTDLIFEYGAHNPAEYIYTVPGSGQTKNKRIPECIGVFELSTFVSHYGGVYWRPLLGKSREQKRKLRENIQKILKVEETSKSNVFASNMDFLTKIPLTEALGKYVDKLNTPQVGICCSSVIAATLATADIIKLDRQIGSYRPCDLASNPILWNLPQNPPKPKLIIAVESPNLFSLNK